MDLYWLVLPALHPEGPTFHWTAVTAFLGWAGWPVASPVWRCAGHYTLPVKDPYMAESLRYVQP